MNEVGSCKASRHDIFAYDSGVALFDSNYICFCSLFSLSKEHGANFRYGCSLLYCVFYSGGFSLPKRQKEKHIYLTHTHQCLKPQRGRLVSVIHFDTYSPMLMTLLGLTLLTVSLLCHYSVTLRKLLSAEGVWHFEAISPRLFCPSLYPHAIKLHILWACSKT